MKRLFALAVTALSLGIFASPATASSPHAARSAAQRAATHPSFKKSERHVFRHAAPQNFSKKSRRSHKGFFPTSSPVKLQKQHVQFSVSENVPRPIVGDNSYF